MASVGTAYPQPFADKVAMQVVLLVVDYAVLVPGWMARVNGAPFSRLHCSYGYCHSHQYSAMVKSGSNFVTSVCLVSYRGPNPSTEWIDATPESRHLVGGKIKIAGEIRVVLG